MKSLQDRQQGFSLVEILISLSLLAVVSLILVSIVNSTGSAWRYASSKVEQFRSAQTAFEAITRRLSQATLNTSWGYEYPGNDTTKPPTRYSRQSDLRFIAGNAESLVASASPRRPTHAAFFQAPLGYVNEAKDFGGLDNLLNTIGYYVEFNREVRPPFMDSMSATIPQRYRYRLMELIEPSNELTIYSKTSSTAGYDGTKYQGHEWFTAPLNQPSAPAHVLSENVIALIIQPKLSKLDDPTGNALAPQYSYDSTLVNAGDPKINPKNQLPPVVQVTLVAIDEKSAKRIANGESKPEFDSLLNSLFVDAANYDADVETLQKALTGKRINFRIFTSTVSLRGAKWSTK
jgi:uncharacterized protein (TIGR02599 family)